jgi:hypothetical protein
MKTPTTLRLIRRSPGLWIYVDDMGWEWVLGFPLEAQQARQSGEDAVPGA